MKRIARPLSALRPARFALLVGLLLMFGAGRPRCASAGIIIVNNASDVPVPGFCDLRQAIVAHNEKTQPFPSDCDPGTGDDLIELKTVGTTIDLGSPLNAIENGQVKIQPINPGGCYNFRQAAYLTVNQGATLTLDGISVVVNGAEFRSVIDNNGGKVTIKPFQTTACEFSNQNGTERKTTLGGVLHNRNGGTTIINAANFVNSAAGDNGGAIYIGSGSVTINGGSFDGNTAPHGGAIFVNRGATLNITSSNFTINNNDANFEGGAIYNSGGNIVFQRNPDLSSPLKSVSIASNHARRGGAIYDLGGQLSIDGMQFLGNTVSESGGAIQISDVVPPNPASVTRTYFRDNSAAGVGSSIYATDHSTLNISGDTFLRNKGGILADSVSTLNITNSTFLGTTPTPEGITVTNGTGDATFSTLVLANFAAPSSLVHVSNSLLREVRCSGVLDESNNLQQQSIGCPGTSERTLDLFSGLLADNGGPTPTIALVTPSPAINALPTGDCLDLSGHPLTIDQRGFGRPFPMGGLCDTGAFEFGASAVGPGIGGIPPGTTF
jgi:hypothetical protein